MNLTIETLQAAFGLAFASCFGLGVFVGAALDGVLR